MSCSYSILSDSILGPAEGAQEVEAHEGLNDTTFDEEDDEGDQDGTMNYSLSHQLSEMERQAERLLRLTQDRQEGQVRH